jgi:hypothetical protein
MFVVRIIVDDEKIDYKAFDSVVGAKSVSMLLG